jgi:hypothetical protein
MNGIELSEIIDLEDGRTWKVTGLDEKGGVTLTDQDDFKEIVYSWEEMGIFETGETITDVTGWYAKVLESNREETKIQVFETGEVHVRPTRDLLAVDDDAMCD